MNIKKNLSLLSAVLILTSSGFSQEYADLTPPPATPVPETESPADSNTSSEEDFFDSSAFSSNDDDLFGGTVTSSSSDDNLFGGDDFFFDDGIEEWTPPAETSDAKAHGVLFDSGSIKIGGRLTSKLGTSTVLCTSAESENTIWDNLGETTLTPSLSTQLTLDARPTQTLRMFLKTQMGLSASYTGSNGSGISSLLTGSGNNGLRYTMSTPEINEMFTDFSYMDRAFFRFGLHTVSWGTGYFFSPVSDIINTSSINPEDVTEAVSGCVNLRTQITFPGTQNCLWIYIVPPVTAAGVRTNLSEEDLEWISSIDTTGAGDRPVRDDYETDEEYQTAMTEWTQKLLDSIQDQIPENQEEVTTDGSLANIYLKHMGIAAKGEVVIGGWELGAGGFYRYENAPKLMATFSGSVYHGKIGVFGEGLYQLGGDSEWSDSTAWNDKTHIFQATVGCMRMISDSNITIAAQYYYDGNSVDLVHKYFTYGHNLAALVSFGEFFNSSDWSCQLFGMINFGKKDIEEALPEGVTMKDLKDNGIDLSSYLTQATIFMNLAYTPASNISFSFGPYISIPDFKSNPNVSLRFTATLGGGKF